MSREELDVIEARLLEESMRADYKDVGIRLRKGNYQYDMAEGIASFQLELRFPDVKEIIERLYSNEKAEDQQFVRKIQTILKKMENNSVLRILPKKKPWELQRYALSSFKFIDVDKKPVVFATPEEIDRVRNLLGSAPNMQHSPASRRSLRTSALLLTVVIAIAYMVVLWSLLQPIIQPLAFIPAFCTAVACSVMLGKLRGNSGKID